MAMSQEEIFEKVREVLEDALGVDEDEVTPEASLTTDLGAESIDFLDIVFRLEKAFDIKIPQGELFDEKILQDERFVQGGQVTDAGIAELKERSPFADFSKIEGNRDINEVMSIFTVDAVCKFVQNKLES